MATSRDHIVQLIQKMKQEFDAAGGAGLEENRRRFDQTGASTPLPEGTLIDEVSMNDHLKAEWLKPANIQSDQVIMYLHGGGYSIGSPRSHRPICARIANAAKLAVLSLDYRLAPEHPYPAALNDALDGYHWLQQQNISPGKIIFAGDSAGGGLMMAALLALKEQSLPMPAGAVGISAWLDLECSSDSYKKNKDIDLLASEEGLRFVGRAYAKKSINKSPKISPFYAEDLAGLCPLLIQVGDAETLLDENIHFAEQARTGGVDVSIQVWPNMVHVWHSLYGLIPEAEEAINAIAGWIKKLN